MIESPRPPTAGPGSPAGDAPGTRAPIRVAPAPGVRRLPNLLGFNRERLAALFQDMGERPFRASQVMKWIHQLGVDDFAAMTNLGKPLRARLALEARIEAPRVVSEQRSADGTVKWLLQVDAGNAIETVFIPEEGRGTLCVSSQVGCALNCSFCSTAQQGFNRNLGAAEIAGQLWLARRALGDHDAGDARRITNVVLMGMGEPLLNFDAVTEALDLMLEDFAYGLSRRRVTLSTAGHVPGIDRLAARRPVALAVSLHAPDDALRDELVPLNRTFPIAELMAACRRYLAHDPRQRITFEYVMLDGVNDSPRPAPRGAARGRALEGQPDPVQPVSARALPALPGRAHRGVPRHPALARAGDDHAQDPGRRHRRGVRPARRPGAGAQQPRAGPSRLRRGGGRALRARDTPAATARELHAPRSRGRCSAGHEPRTHLTITGISLTNQLFGALSRIPPEERS